MRAAVLAFLLCACSRAPAANPPAMPSPSPSPAVPPAIACLAKHYGATTTSGGLVIGGITIPYDDGKQKTFEEKLATPDIEDAFSIRYETGKIEPVTKVDDDPGRIRIDALFRHAYGDADVVRIDFLGQKLPVHRKAEPAFARVAKRLAGAGAESKPFLKNLGGTFVQRNIAGTDRPSAHSYGISIDLNTKLSHYWQWEKGPITWKNRVPQEIVDAFEAEGFIWGGRWYHYDTMHFEWRPELFDEDCHE